MQKKYVFYLLENKKEKIQNVIQNRPKSKYNVIEPYFSPTYLPITSFELQ